LTVHVEAARRIEAAAAGDIDALRAVTSAVCPIR
jgi:hypothetical protein